MVTATNGTVVLSNGSRDWSYNVYISDVANAAVTWSTIGAAASGSSNFIIAPDNVFIKDISIVTGPTVIANLIPFANDVSTGQIIGLANVLTTLQSRSFPRIGFTAGRKVQIFQA